jgi:NAD+ diphosphatase
MNYLYEPAVAPPVIDDQPAWWFVFRGNRLLVKVEDGSASLPLLTDFSDLGLSVIRRQYLGRIDGRHSYSVELDGEAQAPEGWTFQGLRRLFGLLPESLFWVAGAAVQIVDWDRCHQHCGRCGAGTRDKPKERAKECLECGLLSYPRISPAIIVLVERDDTLLLARSRRHPQGLFSVLAGFVEPGETLEGAVAREIKEEVGIDVRDIRYFGSQPWPFPNSLMIAFTCHYAAGEIVLEEEELAEAAWYSVGDLPPIPPKISIARRLIDWFVDQQDPQLASPLNEWTFKE